MNAAQGIEDEPSGKQLPTILVVDDVVLARMVAASQLRHHGFAVIEVSSADEAMRILERVGEGRSGVRRRQSGGQQPGRFRIGRWVRDNKPGMKVLLTSGVVRSPGPGR